MHALAPLLLLPVLVPRLGAQAVTEETPLNTAPSPSPTTVHEATSIADVIGCKVLAIAPDGSRLATVDQKRQTAWILDSESGNATEAPHAGAVQSVAVDSNGITWLGLDSGAVIKLGPRGAEQRFDASEHPVDGLSTIGGVVAWSASTGDVAGSLDARSGERLWSTETRLGGYRQPRVFLSRDGRLAFVRAPSRRLGGRIVIRLLDSRTGKQIDEIEGYGSHRDEHMPLGLGTLFVAQRADSHAFRLVQRNLLDQTDREIDSELRGKHFVDLIASPRAPLMAEGDFEDRGAVLYDLSGANVRKLPIGAKGAMPVGFAEINGRECLLTTTGPTRTGLTAWSIATGEAVAVDLEAARGKRVVRAGSALRGRRLWIQWWRSVGKRSIEHHLELLRVRD